MTKSKTIILLIFLFNFVYGQQDSSLTRLGLKNILYGDFDKSVKFFSEAIKQDSLAYENYYFRGLTRAWLSDTSNCINDFFKAIDLKKKYPTIPIDTVINNWLTSKPTPARYMCSHSLDNQSDAFFDIWLGTWLMLTDPNKTEACENFRQAEKDGIRQLKYYIHKYCK